MKIVAVSAHVLRTPDNQLTGLQCDINRNRISASGRLLVHAALFLCFYKSTDL